MLPSSEQIVIGALMRNPTFLLERDKYQLNKDDFHVPVYKYVFAVIHNMVAQGARNSITIPEIENFLGESSKGREIYSQWGGQQPFIDALENAEGIANNFEVAYNILKKENLLSDLQKANFNTDEFYMDDEKGNHDKRIEINQKYLDLSAQDIIHSLQNKLFSVTSKYTKGDASKSQTLNEGLQDMILGLEEYPEIGAPLQGGLFNHIIGGALLDRFYLRSGASGLGKSRAALADAAYLAFPLRYNWEKQQWEKIGLNEKVLFIITEQDIDEIQKMAVAYLTGINESVFKRGKTSKKQKEIIQQAFKVFEIFEDNFHIIRVPNPSISAVKALVREHVTLHNIQYVFYDYIFESPALYAEFKGTDLRTDQMLFAFSDAMKNLAVELNIFIMSSTQVNAKSDSSKDIRNEASLAGSRAVINKADMGCIMARPTKEELQILSEVTTTYNIEPNIVTDIYKLRGGEYTQVRIWSHMDLGTMRKVDLFVTNSRLEPIDIDYELTGYYIQDDEETKKLVERLNGEQNDR